jgi:uncharacterized protein (DUF1778 family)
MDLSQYVQQLREDLASAAAAGDEQTQRTGALLGAAIEPAARLALMNALSDLEVRLDGRDVRVAVSRDETAEPEPEPDQGPPFGGFGDFRGADTGDISRITLRLVEQIKNQAEQAAAAQGVSLNSWVAQAVQGALAGHRKQGRHGDRTGDRGGKRLRGWVEG